VTSAQFLLDSESSINSDFKRYDQSMMSTSSQQQSHDKHAMHNMDAMDEQQPHAMHDSPQIVGHIESVDLELGILRIHHGPIAAWQRPAMTMNFKLAPGLSIPDLRAGDTVLFRFTASAEGFVISELSLSAVKTEDDHAAHSTETSA